VHSASSPTPDFTHPYISQSWPKSTLLTFDTDSLRNWLCSCSRYVDPVTQCRSLFPSPTPCLPLSDQGVLNAIQESLVSLPHSVAKHNGLWSGYCCCFALFQVFKLNVIRWVSYRLYGNLIWTTQRAKLTLWRLLCTAIKHPGSDWVKPSFVTFDIRALWSLGLIVRVPGCQKLQMTA